MKSLPKNFLLEHNEARMEILLQIYELQMDHKDPSLQHCDISTKLALQIE